ncbi:MAG: tetratricopeptide repeat protein [Candidatus Hydrogenedentes bacterium]|nr:tetratricopeptide repeat protein [Candidatus Hydrogenedentota bacterium]
MWRYCLAVAVPMLVVGWTTTVQAAEFVNGGTAPVIMATDINGNQVNINELIEQEPYVVIVHFFSVSTGEEVALKLRYLHLNYGKDRVKIIALGMKEDEAALKKFADALDIQYFIIDTTNLQNPDWLTAIDVLPMTLFVHPSKDLLIERVIRGGGKSKADVLKELAETLYRKQEDAEMAVQVATESAKDPAVTQEATELKGYILAGEGKLDEAEKEFTQIDSKTGLAVVAKERGDLDKAVELADQAAGDPYAATVKGQALREQGKFDEAKQALGSAAAQPAEEWKQSDALNAQGRLEQATGNPDAAVKSYQNAVALDPLNVVALSNEGSVHRAKGDPESLQKAQELLEKASERGKNDQLVTAMLQQVQRELSRANDLEKKKLIQEQIATLSQRFKEMKQNATQPIDDWSSRPLVVAFLPSSDQTPVFFERAGTDVVVQRELETRLQADGRVSVVERQMLDHA